MADADEITEAYADWQVRCNGNRRLAKMLRGWDRVVHLVASDTGDGFTVTVAGSVLADLVPKLQEAILERGRQVGNDRVLAGVHHPSDVEAGQKLGAALAAIWLKDPARRGQLDAARAAEWGS